QAHRPEGALARLQARRRSRRGVAALPAIGRDALGEGTAGKGGGAGRAGEIPGLRGVAVARDAGLLRPRAEELRNPEMTRPRSRADRAAIGAVVFLMNQLA